MIDLQVFFFFNNSPVTHTNTYALIILTSMNSSAHSPVSSMLMIGSAISLRTSSPSNFSTSPDASTQFSAAVLTFISLTVYPTSPCKVYRPF